MICLGVLFLITAVNVKRRRVSSPTAPALRREPPANRARLEEALSSEDIDYDQVVALRA